MGITNTLPSVRDYIKNTNQTNQRANDLLAGIKTNDSTINHNFRAALKVALADGEINADEKKNLDKIKDRDSFSSQPIYYEAPQSRGLGKKARRALREFQRMLDKDLFYKPNFSISLKIKDKAKPKEVKQAKDPVIDAYETAGADGTISKEEVAVLKELVAA